MLGWWRRRSLRARITVLATAVFAVAFTLASIASVVTVSRTLVRESDDTARMTARGIASLIDRGQLPNAFFAGTGDVTFFQVVDDGNKVVTGSPGYRTAAVLTTAQLAAVRQGRRVQLEPGPTRRTAQRVLGVSADAGRTVVVGSDLARLREAVAVTRRATLVFVPLTLALMALLTYWVVGLALRAVGELRSSAARITVTGLSSQRLPVPEARDEVHRLAVTLNLLLDRIDVATTRQRRFVGDAAHELRSPIASLRTQLEVARHLGPEEDWESVATDALQDVDRLGRLVEDLLALARLDEAGGRLPRRLPTDLADLARRTVADYPGARVPIRLTTEPSTVVGDPEALRRVVLNLVDNAVRYSATWVEVSVRGGQAMAEITVADDGPGIPEGKRQAVFDRFVRLDAARARDTGGTGLGLAIVRDVVRAHGGAVTLQDNRPGLRATVALPTLPDTSVPVELG